MLCFILLTLLSLTASSEDKVLSAEINNDGETTSVETENVQPATTVSETETAHECNKDYTSQLSDLQLQISALTTQLKKQKSTIESLNATLQEYIIYGKDSGFLQNINAQLYFGLLSSYTHENYPFVMLEVMSVRLPSRDALPVDRRKKHGSLVLLK